MEFRHQSYTLKNNDFLDFTFFAQWLNGRHFIDFWLWQTVTGICLSIIHHIISCCENLKKIGTTLPMHRTVRGFLTSPGILLLFFGDLIPRTTLRIHGPCYILITIECRAVLDLLHWQYGIPNDRATFSTCHVTYSITGVVCFWNRMTTSDMLCPGKNEFFCAIYPEFSGA